MGSRSAIPGHVAIIMDGNGRWARKRMMPRSYGHKKGVEAVRRAIAFFARAGVSQLTLFAFSSENWRRPEEEVSSLMSLFVSSLQKNTDELDDKGIRIRFIGDREAFSSRLREQIERSEAQTRDNRQMTLNIAANYGGQWDILQAARSLAADCAAGTLQPADMDEARFAARLSMPDAGPVDLFIRTGGERRISNFLLWQSAYAELYFCDTLWPDFGEAGMQAALDDYASRQRRFGKTGEQVEPAAAGGEG
jgi:undecaprenyl diphosphate synthase